MYGPDPFLSNSKNRISWPPEARIRQITVAFDTFSSGRGKISTSLCENRGRTSGRLVRDSISPPKEQLPVEHFSIFIFFVSVFKFHGAHQSKHGTPKNTAVAPTSYALDLKSRS